MRLLFLPLLSVSVLALVYGWSDSCRNLSTAVFAAAVLDSVSRLIISGSTRALPSSSWNNRGLCTLNSMLGVYLSKERRHCIPIRLPCCKILPMAIEQSVFDKNTLISFYPSYPRHLSYHCGIRLVIGLRLAALQVRSVQSHSNVEKVMKINGMFCSTCRTHFHFSLSPLFKSAKMLHSNFTTTY
ncbi:hypothetical protein T03_17908 [Trichinella britovi]|uniref:Secreted protein n=1 Tax=Trichinella britovi TaxID=45882 RepID=A0A0V1D4Z6_TRIBR|nr:hypothetical protein T03_17908 [Trichinella britovi]